MSSNERKPKAESQLMEEGDRRSSAGSSKKTMHKRLIKGSTGIFLNGLVFRNPVAVGALGLSPVVGTGYTIQDAVVLSLVMLVMMSLVRVLSGWMKISVRIRPVVAPVLSGVMCLSVTALAKQLMPQAFFALSIYAVLTTGNSTILPRVNNYAPSHITLAVLMDSLGCTVGFSVMTLLVTALREIWGNIVKDTGGVYHAGMYPPIGLLLLGVIAALIQRTNVKWAVVGRKVEQEWE